MLFDYLTIRYVIVISDRYVLSICDKCNKKQQMDTHFFLDFIQSFKFICKFLISTDTICAGHVKQKSEKVEEKKKYATQFALM